MAELGFYATGRRKTAIARVWLRPGEGKITVNKKNFEEYFPTETLRNIILHPLKLTNSLEKYNLLITVTGGGISGQAGALRHGIARVLLQSDINLRSILRKEGFLTRDPREIERKKYGQKKARKRFQFSKR
ncbi:MAG: 30S ribosomal protein S9 [Candidatus Schekmanbacteria bacterium RBG_16_38_10]|uniref:Small ribosomal subunit protein uS9 n=1 Tax=Candidatus Schekmanbacteria bacterium RBG_16_38_10 TaxID=1817879 RepID=A0A1F7S0C4_9BACT|nr:MAG: 30S ribosomal protein S9 [Candidatus Schekmanbacteria bacterium RBG_16_38_10]